MPVQLFAGVVIELCKPIIVHLLGKGVRLAVGDGTCRGRASLGELLSQFAVSGTESNSRAISFELCEYLCVFSLGLFRVFCPERLVNFLSTREGGYVRR